MKKLLTGLLAIAMLLSCICILSACSVPKPELDLKDAAEALEDEDYHVYYYDDEDMSGFNYAMEETLYAYDDDHDNYIRIMKFKSAASAKLYYKQVKEWNEFEQEAEKSYLEVMEHSLKTYEDNLSSDEIDELEDKIKDCKKTLKENEEDYVVGRSGVYVWYGTKDAIKDSKG